MVQNKAFSLVELTVTLVIVSILLAAFMPTITKKMANNKTAAPIITKQNEIPIGAIVMWYGDNYPKDWLPMDGRDITDSKYKELRDIIQDDKLPALNAMQETDMPIGFIIKADK